MSAFATILAFWLTPAALIVAWFFADRWLDRRAEKRRREQQNRQVDAEWLAVLAAPETTPVYDQLVCESIERAEGWAL